MKRAEWNAAVNAWERALTVACNAREDAQRARSEADAFEEKAGRLAARAQVAESDARQVIMAYGEAAARREREGIDEDRPPPKPIPPSAPENTLDRRVSLLENVVPSLTLLSVELRERLPKRIADVEARVAALEPPASAPLPSDGGGTA